MSWDSEPVAWQADSVVACPVASGLTDWRLPRTGALLADILDYDELIAGVRREGMYVVLEENIMQFVDICATTVPLLLLSSAGYRNNGGCSCGCGVHCPLPYQRWGCDADIGYACSSSLRGANTPFYGDPGRGAPCTLQPPAVVNIIVTLFHFVPAFFYMLAFIPTLFAPIDAEMQREIKKRTMIRHQGSDHVHDPVTNQKLKQYPSTQQRAADTLVQHFEQDELHLVHTKGPMALLRRLLLRLLLWIALMVSIGSLILLGGPRGTRTV